MLKTYDKIVIILKSRGTKKRLNSKLFLFSFFLFFVTYGVFWKKSFQCFSPCEKMSEQVNWKFILSKITQSSYVIVSLDSNTRKFKVEFEDKIVSQFPRVKHKTEGHKFVICTLRTSTRDWRIKWIWKIWNFIWNHLFQMIVRTQCIVTIVEWLDYQCIMNITLSRHFLNHWIL